MVSYNWGKKDWKFGIFAISSLLILIAIWASLWQAKEWLILIISFVFLGPIVFGILLRLIYKNFNTTYFRIIDNHLVVTHRPLFYPGAKIAVDDIRHIAVKEIIRFRQTVQGGPSEPLPPTYTLYITLQNGLQKNLNTNMELDVAEQLRQQVADLIHRQTATTAKPRAKDTKLFEHQNVPTGISHIEQGDVTTITYHWAWKGWNNTPLPFAIGWNIFAAIFITITILSKTWEALYCFVPFTLIGILIALFGFYMLVNSTVFRVSPNGLEVFGHPLYRPGAVHIAMSDLAGISLNEGINPDENNVPMQFCIYADLKDSSRKELVTNVDRPLAFYIHTALSKAIRG